MIPKLLVLSLEESLKEQFKLALAGLKMKIHLTIADRAVPGKFDVVFCGLENLKAALSISPNSVVVSRLADDSAWLEALDSGAADFCAAPFEPTQLRWLLQSRLHQQRLAA